MYNLKYPNLFYIVVILYDSLSITDSCSEIAFCTKLFSLNIFQYSKIDDENSNLDKK
jgi:hypothetical protein